MDVVERRIARIAGRQDNVITRRQLRAAGLSDRQVAVRVGRGQLRRLHRGVYLIGPAPPTLLARARAALLACGEEAVVSHGLAAALWGMLDPPPLGAADIIVAGSNPGLRPGITLHRVRALHPSEQRRRDGLRLTSPARTLIDLAAARSRAEVEQALQEAVVKRLVNDRELERLLRLRPRAPGAAAMQRILAQEKGPGFTRSEAERALMRVVHGAGLPLPEKNVQVCGLRVDAAWPAHRLIVEVDGRLAHDHGLAFERDRRRDQVLVAGGWTVIRFTYRQLRDEPLAVAARLAQALVQPTG